MRRLVVLAIATLAAASPAFAQGGGTIVDSDATFVRVDPTAFDGTPTANFTGVAVSLPTDNIFEYGWWIRSSGDAFEAPLGTPDSFDYTGNMSSLAWNSVTADGLGVQELTAVTDAGVAGSPDGGYVVSQLAVSNPGASSVTVDVFHYLDMDLAGTSTGDSATLIEYPNLIEITDSSTGVTANYVGAGADALQVRPFAQLRTLLNDSAPTNLDNSGLPFAAADFTGGFQWASRTLAPGETLIIAVGTSVGVELRCLTPVSGVFCDAFESGDTSFWSQIQP